MTILDYAVLFIEMFFAFMISGSVLFQQGLAFFYIFSILFFFRPKWGERSLYGAKIFATLLLSLFILRHYLMLFYFALYNNPRAESIEVRFNHYIRVYWIPGRTYLHFEVGFESLSLFLVFLFGALICIWCIKVDFIAFRARSFNFAFTLMFLPFYSISLTRIWPFIEVTTVLSILLFTLLSLIAIAITPKWTEEKHLRILVETAPSKETQFQKFSKKAKEEKIGRILYPLPENSVSALDEFFSFLFKKLNAFQHLNFKLVFILFNFIILIFTKALNIIRPAFLFIFWFLGFIFFIFSKIVGFFFWIYMKTIWWYLDTMFTFYDFLNSLDYIFSSDTIEAFCSFVWYGVLRRVRYEEYDVDETDYLELLDEIRAKQADDEERPPKEPWEEEEVNISQKKK